MYIASRITAPHSLLMRFRVHQQNRGKTIQAYKMIIKQLTHPAAGTGLEQKLNSYVHENLGQHSSSQGKVNRIKCKMLASNRGNLLVNKSKLDYFTCLFFFLCYDFLIQSPAQIILSLE